MPGTIEPSTGEILLHQHRLTTVDAKFTGLVTLRSTPILTPLMYGGQLTTTSFPAGVNAFIENEFGIAASSDVDTLASPIEGNRNLITITGSANYNGSFGLGYLMANVGAIGHDGSGTVFAVQAVLAHIATSSTGIITNVSGFYMLTSQVSGGGGITNLYGVYIESLVQGSSSGTAGVTAVGLFNMPGTANGIVTVTSLYGVEIPTASISVGNQTATTTNFAPIHIGIQTLTSTDLVRTVTNLASLKIDGAPVASTNVTPTNGPYALWVDADLSRFDGNIVMLGGTDIRPLTDSTTALGIANAAGTDFVVFDTTNSRIHTGAATAPSFPIHISNNAPTTGANTAIMRLDGSLTSTTVDQEGFDANITINPGSATTRVYYGQLSRPTTSENANMASAVIASYGIIAAPGIGSGNTVGFVAGMYIVTINVSGTIANNYSVWIPNPINSGTAITNNYAIRIETQTTGATLDYGLYIGGADTYAIHVDGGITRLDGTVQLGMGTGTGLSNAVGVADVNNTAVGNVGTGTDDLMTYSLPTNSLSGNEKGVKITAWGTFANNANAKTLTLAFGSATILTNALTINVAATWYIEAYVFRTGTDTQDYVAKLVTVGAAGVAVNDIESGTATQDDGAAIVIKCTGTATTNDDIVQDGLVVEFYNQ